jgi:hypothetical protein
MSSLCYGLKHERYLKLRLRLNSVLPADIHREFIGLYFPETATLIVYEFREILGNSTMIKELKLLPCFEEHVYVTSEGKPFELNEIMIGTMINLPDHPKSQRDRCAVKGFIIIEMDTGCLLPELSRPLTTTNINTLQLFTEKKISNMKPVNISSKPISEGIVGKIQSRLQEYSSFRQIGKCFQVVDLTGERKALKQDLKKVLCSCVPDLSASELEAVMTGLNSNSDRQTLDNPITARYVTYTVYLDLVKCNMNEVRRLCVLQSFRKVDYNHNGVLTADELSGFYKATYHPKIIEGEMAEKDMLLQFLADLLGTTVDRVDLRTTSSGKVKFEDFEDYYLHRSLLGATDDDFVARMTREWNLDHRNLVLREDKVVVTAFH